ncbi:unnamed protein product [Acanthoscelides obtectus]|uniref:Reverse transcriptase n=1 Tax=Acanthoscelides obtectus TaxID=200917 RepID=A0A9P0PRU6_ACAOB|nr:unnamed protein product [Acanthoscelides obtectus]CAK1682240.1 hypothetical protein AOBTE_LOCUS33506 [Acanthoscelides obtectus]
MAMPVSGAKTCNSGARSSPYQCTTCDHAFSSSAQLRRHVTARACGDKLKCGHCPQRFGSFRSTRLHERKAHSVEYAKEAADLRDPVPETEIFQIMAGIEAQNPAGHINKRMAEVTSLTIDQIRGKRRKPDYQKYLELAKRKLQAPGSRKPTRSVDTPAIAPGRSTTTGCDEAPMLASRNIQHPASSQGRLLSSAIASPLPQEAAAKQKRPRESYSPRELNPAKRKSQPAKSRQNKQRNECNPDGTDPTSAPSEMRKRKRVASPSGSGIQTTSKEPGSAVNSPNDRPATDSSPSNTLKSHRDTLNDGPGTSYSHAVAESSPCAHGAVLPQKSPNPPAPLVNLNSTFVEYLREGRGVFTEAGHRDIRRLIDMAIFGSPEQLAVALDRWVESKLNKKAPINRVQRRNQQPGRHYNQSKGSSGKRASEYKKAQDLFARDRSGLADIVFGGRSMYEPPKLPTILEVETLFAGIWESPAGTDDEAISDPKAATSEFFYSISPDVVSMAKTNWQNSAPGLDGLTIADIKKIDNKELSIVYTIILGRNIHPTTWKYSRTVLVPKDGDSAKADNNRPITIGSSLQRLMHRIVNNRIGEAVQLNHHQRGFKRIDGTLANVLILDHYIGSRVEAGKSYNVLSVDIRKAFDSVSHSFIIRGLERVGLEKEIVDYIRESLTNCHTAIKVGKEFSRPINICRGVEKGDPLSPILFNIVVDELLEYLNRNWAGGTLNSDVRMAAMGFAYDLVIIADRVNDLQVMLGEVELFFQGRRMILNPRKCSALCAVTSSGDKRPLPITKPFLSVGGVKIPQIDMLSTFKYLGHHYGATGVRKANIPNLQVWLGNIDRAPLKPDQKLTLLRDFLLPKLQHGLQSLKIMGGVLKDVDGHVRGAVKRYLHMSIHTTDAAIHAKIKDGGLGIPELRRVVPQILLKRITKLLEETGDETVSCVIQSDRTLATLRRLQNLAGDIPAEQLWREAIASKPTTSGMQHTSEDDASRSWLRTRPSGSSGRDYARAVHLRTNNLPTNGLPYKPAEQRLCRNKGCKCVETLHHVLQKCGLAHEERIRRHNEVARNIAAHADADVQISWEGNEGLGPAWQRKKLLYGNTKLIEAARLRWPGKSFEFLPITVGARGVWPRCNEPTKHALGLTKQLKESCVHSVLKWGSSIHAAFMRRARAIEART